MAHTVYHPFTQENDPTRKGELASVKVLFGSHSRYSFYAVHTRFRAVQWFIDDAEAFDAYGRCPAVIRQYDTFGEVEGFVDAIESQPEPDEFWYDESRPTAPESV